MFYDGTRTQLIWEVGGIKETEGPQNRGIFGSAWRYQKAMGQHIQGMSESNGNGKYPMFDPETRSLVQLEFKKLHDSVELKGRANQYFVSCADFVAPDGTLYDLDFFLSMKHDVVSVLVHSKNGQKTPYDIH